MYELLKKDGMAKRGRFHTVHGTIETPVFMNVGTQAAIKGGVSALDLRDLSCQIELSNTYHLHVRTGDKLIKELESKRGALQQQIAETESLLKNTKKDVGSQLNGLAALTGQIEERKRYIIAINNDVEAVGREIAGLERQLRGLQRDLKDKKKKYESSVQYLYKNKSVEEKLMFIFSAKSLGQTYRRLRYVREYATYQRLQGEEILKKQEQVNRKKKELQQVKVAKENLLREREGEKAKLEAQEKES